MLSLTRFLAFSMTVTVYRARLYSFKTGEPLAVLSYHRMSLHAIAFAPCKPLLPKSTLAGEDDSSDEEEGVRLPRAWLATGGKDDRISLWEVYPPKRKA